MSTFTWILDAACINTHVICKVNCGGEIYLLEFKRRIIIEFVGPLIIQRSFKRNSGAPDIELEMIIKE